jgi:hypothetical protein
MTRPFGKHTPVGTRNGVHGRSILRASFQHREGRS